MNIASGILDRYGSFGTYNIGTYGYAWYILYLKILIEDNFSGDFISVLFKKKYYLV